MRDDAEENVDTPEDSVRGLIGLLLLNIGGVPLGCLLLSDFGPEQASVSGFWYWVESFLRLPATITEWAFGTAATVGSAGILAGGVLFLITAPLPATAVALWAIRPVMLGVALGAMAGVAGFAASGSLAGIAAALIILGIAAVAWFLRMMTLAFTSTIEPKSSRERDPRPWQDWPTLRRHMSNALVVLIGIVVVWSVVGSGGGVIAATRLANDIAESQDLARQGRDEESATLAFSVLEKEPTSIQAAWLFACAGWRARYFDDAATIVNNYSEHGLSPAALNDCTEPLAMEQLVTTAGAVFETDSEFLLVRDKKKKPVVPSIGDVVEFVRQDHKHTTQMDQGFMTFAALTCHNRAAGFPRLARAQLRDMSDVVDTFDQTVDEAVAGSPPRLNALLSQLPSEWGCGHIDDFSND